MKYEKTDRGMLSHLAEASKYREYMEEGAQHASVDISIVYGIGSRESGWGLLLKPPGPEGTGDFSARKFTTKFRLSSKPPDGYGFGRGLMQIDYDAHPFARSKEMEWKDPKKNIMYGCGVLLENRRLMGRQKKYNLTPEAELFASLAAYNTGGKNVLISLNNGISADHRTSHRNYATDVMARAAWFREVGGWKA